MEGADPAVAELQPSWASPGRVLPWRVRPRSEEPLDSWLEAMAAGHRATMREMTTALGLTARHPTAPGTVTVLPVRKWLTALTPAQAGALEHATGIPAARFQKMTLPGFAPSAVTINQAGWISNTSPSAGTAGSYCPECLAEDGGRWQLAWRFRFGFACATHRRILVDACPGCHLDPRRAPHPAGIVAEPGHCHRWVPGDTNSPRNLCRADLTQAPAQMEAPEPVLAAQHAITQLATSGRDAAFGIYQDHPQPATPVLADLRLLTRIAGKALARGEELEAALAGEELLSQYRATAHLPYGPSSAVASIRSATGMQAAYQALSDPEQTLALLRGRVATETFTRGCTPQLQHLVAVACNRRRRPTTVLRAVTRPPAAADLRARKVPALLWDNWLARIPAPRIEPELLAGALSAAVVLAGTTLTHADALQRLDNHMRPEAPARQLSYVLQQISRSPEGGETLEAVLTLAQYLDAHESPIDYARRRALDCATLLPPAAWRRICQEMNVNPGGTKSARLAHAYVCRIIIRDPIGNLVPRGRGGTITAAQLAAFAAAIPPRLRLALHCRAADFLAEHGIHEPLRWEPPLDRPAALPRPDRRAQTRGRGWSAVRPAQAAADAVDLAARYQAGTSARQLAKDTGASRQTVVRVLNGAGIATRPGRVTVYDIDPDWLRRRYLEDHRSISQLAKEAGCRPTTISRLLRKARIPIRPRGEGSKAANALPPDLLDGASELLRRVVTDRHTLEVARRFLVAARNPSIGQAAKEIGIAPSVLSTRLVAMRKRAGGPLLINAKRGAPHALTPLGKRLAAELRQLLGDHVENSAEQPAASN